jgi:hypothetical protein
MVEPEIPNDTDLGSESGNDLRLHVEPSNADVDHDARERGPSFDLTSDGNLDRNSLMAPFLLHGAILLPP